MQYEYHAFISYRHCELDAIIAESLHKKLEHYHIPKIIRQITGKKNFKNFSR